MPTKKKSKNPKEKRNYKKEYRDYHSKPKQKKERADRTTNRRRAIREGRVEKGDKTKELDHQPAVRKGADAKTGKTRVVSRSKNRAWRKGKKGYDR